MMVWLHPRPTTHEETDVTDHPSEALIDAHPLAEKATYTQMPAGIDVSVNLRADSPFPDGHDGAVVTVPSLRVARMEVVAVDPLDDPFSSARHRLRTYHLVLVGEMRPSERDGTAYTVEAEVPEPMRLMAEAAARLRALAPTFTDEAHLMDHADVALVRRLEALSQQGI
jgi:hypothetical protein